MSNSARRRNKRSSARRNASARRRRRMAATGNPAERKTTPVSGNAVSKAEEPENATPIAGAATTVPGPVDNGSADDKPAEGEGRPSDLPAADAGGAAGKHGDDAGEHSPDVSSVASDDMHDGPDDTSGKTIKADNDDEPESGPEPETETTIAHEDDPADEPGVDVKDSATPATAEEPAEETDDTPEDEPDDDTGEPSDDGPGDDGEPDDSRDDGDDDDGPVDDDDESEVIIDDIDMGALKTLDHVVFWKVDDFINPVTGKPYGRLHLRNTPPKFVAKEHSQEGDTEVTMFVNAALAEKLAYLFRAIDRSFKGLPVEEDDGPRITTDNWRQVISDYWHDNPLKVIGVVAAVIVIIAIVIAGWVIPK